MRTRVLALPGVRLREGTRVRALERAGGAWRLRVGTPGDGVEEVGADVVVDASGRSSRSPVWLRALGVPAGATTAVDAQVGYATRRCASPRPPGPGVVVLSSPRRPRGVMVSPVEDGRWEVCLIGRGADRPGRDPDALAAHLEGLDDPAARDLVLDLLRGATPVGDVAVHRRTANVRHSYGGRGWPAGLLVVGDALCALNPVHGSGITVAARQALLLERAFARHGTRAATGRLQRALARSVDLPWAVATSQDRRLLPDPGRARPSEAVLGWWAGEVARLAAEGDVHAADVLQAVTHLVAHPAALFAPSLLLAGVRSRVRARTSKV